MGEVYNPYPRLPKNIRQIGDRDQILKLYVEDYVNTYLKRLYPAGGQDLRVGLLLGEVRSQDGEEYLFVDGAMEMDGVTRSGEQVEFTESAWKAAYQVMEQSFPRRSVLGWFLCGTPSSALSPLNYWKQHSRYFSGKNQLMYLNFGLEGEEAIYMASADGFYKLRGYYIYYERNQMMQDYMVSRKDAHRVESGTRDTIIQDFRYKMDENRQVAKKRRSTVGVLGTACGALSVLVLAGGVVMLNNYHKMKEMESVIVSALPEGTVQGWSSYLSKGGAESTDGEGDELPFEEIPGEVYPTRADIVIETGGDAEAAGAAGMAGSQGAGGSGSGASGAADGAAGTSGGQGVSGNGTGVPGAAGGAAGTSAVQGAAGSGTSASGAAGSASGAAGSAAGASGAAGGTSGQSFAGAGAASGTQSEPAQPVQIPADAVRHVVQDGETLYGICMERYHSTRQIQEICRWNQLADENRLAVGQELYLPPTNE